LDHSESHYQIHLNLIINIRNMEGYGVALNRRRWIEAAGHVLIVNLSTG